jgi:hypothetical protein
MRNASLSFVMSVSLSLSLCPSVCPSVHTQGIRCNDKIVYVCTTYSTGKRANTATAQLFMSSQNWAGIKLRAYIVFLILFSLLLLLFHFCVVRTEKRRMTEPIPTSTPFIHLHGVHSDNFRSCSFAGLKTFPQDSSRKNFYQT